MDPQAAKQQVIERIKQAENILVTVSTNPSVDQLAACIGMALMVNKMQKHATAVFSGQIPSTIEFLQPEKTLETNTDSLRDFIISLDKNKADKLRYKVEDKVVRIYITPYRTSLSEKDLEFTQGDYNVDLVLALGVKDKTHLDSAITSHGRILHDATVVCVNAGADKVPDLGQINWQDAQASSLSEMLVSISEALGSGLIDGQIATAFLTGIVAETERFSNPKTTPRVMTMSAQLMAAGANQQLIATKLNPPPPEPPPAAKPVKNQPPKPPGKAPPAGVLNVDHGPSRKSKPEEEVKIDPDEIRIDEQGNIEHAQDIYNKNHPQQQRASGATSALPSMLARQEPAPDAGGEPAITTFKHDDDHDLFATPAPAPDFSIGTGAKDEYYDSMSADQQNNIKDTSEMGGGVISKAPTVEPVTPDMAFKDSAVTAPTVDDARSAVESAISTAPFNAAREGPVASLNAQPLGELHAPPADTLPLPGDVRATPVVDNPVAPPTVPPPLNLGPAVVPNPPSPSTAKQNNVNGSQANPDSPNASWPL